MAMDAAERLGIPNFKTIDTGSSHQLALYPEKDSCGMSVSFLASVYGCAFSVYIDDREMIEIGTNDLPSASDPTYNSIHGKAKIRTFFFSYPRGSKTIRLMHRPTTAGQHVNNSTPSFCFAGFREFYTKPAYEKLTRTESILKTFDISPKQYYITNYLPHTNGSSFYTPQASDDQIQTITVNGSWTGSTSTSVFNTGYRYTSTAGDYIDIKFDLIGDGGGINCLSMHHVSKCRQIEMYLTDTASITEGTDLISHGSLYEAADGLGWSNAPFLGVRGLPAGTYVVRFKQADNGNIWDVMGFQIIDTVAPQENAVTTTDINNDNQGVAYPENVIKIATQRDSDDRVPNYLNRTDFKYGKVSKAEVIAINQNHQCDDEGTRAAGYSTNQYFNEYRTFSNANCEVKMHFFGKSVYSMMVKGFSTGTGWKPEFNGVTNSSFMDFNDHVKNGAGTWSTGTLIQSPEGVKNYSLSCTMSGQVVTMADTKGVRIGERVTLYDGTLYEEVEVASIVADTSFTTVAATSVITIGSVESVDFSGYQHYRLVSSDTTALNISCMAYEPLPITRSKFLQRQSTDMELETIKVFFPDVATGDDLFYGWFSDGVQANWANSTISITEGGATPVWSFPQDLKNIIGTGTVSIEITSTKMVVKNKHLVRD